MKILPYLFGVATDKDAKVNGNLKRSELIAWVYGQVFLAIVTGRPILLRFQDCDAWVEAPGAPERRRSFLGDTAEDVERAVLCDADLAFVLHFDPKTRGPAAYRVTESDAASHDLARLRDALAGISRADLLEAENTEQVRAALTAWVANGPLIRPFSEFEIGSHRPGGRGITITI